MLAGTICSLLAVVVAFAAAALVRRNAERLRLIQEPNARSSHTRPTPGGGGVGIVLGSAVASLWSAILAPWPTLPLLAAGLLMALIGLIDDRRPLPASFRLTAQALLVVSAMATAVPLDALAQQIGLPLPALLLAALAVVAAIYWINLFNFMDGIDGIAGSEAIFMALAAALLLWLGAPDATTDAPFWMLVGLAAASLGFLLLNWPPAKIFMGDAGSTYLGFMLALLALQTIAAGWVSLVQWAILGAAFVSDASVTLVRRALQGERVFEAHRRHAYQVLSRRWGHGPVTIGFIAVNVLWLLPLALLAGRPGWAAVALALAYLPLVGAAILFRAGAPEIAVSRR